MFKNVYMVNHKFLIARKWYLHRDGNLKWKIIKAGEIWLLANFSANIPGL